MYIFISVIGLIAAENIWTDKYVQHIDVVFTLSTLVDQKMSSRFLVPIFSCWAEMALMIRTALQKATLIVRRLFQMNFFRGGQFRGVMRNLPRIGPVDENHAVFRDRSMFEFPEGTKAATFGMGCFWGVERLFWNLNPKIYTTQGQCQKFASLVIGLNISWLRWWRKRKSNIWRNVHEKRP